MFLNLSDFNVSHSVSTQKGNYENEYQLWNF